MIVKKEDVLSTLGELSAEERAFMEKNASMVCDLINKATAGLLSKEDVDMRIKEITEKLDSVTTENSQLKEFNKTLGESVKNLTEAIEKAKQRGVSPTAINNFFEKFDTMMDSQKMKDFIEGTDKNSGWFDGFKAKDIENITSVENNYDGDVLISRQSDILANPYQGPKTSIRDVIRTIPGDATHPNFTYLRVKKFDRNARYETENGRLAQSNLEFEEVNATTRRVGSYFDISKNLLLARVQLRAFLVAMIPGIIRQAENFGILFGDGAKNHLLGIKNVPGVGSIEEQITGEIESGEAGDVVKVESYEGGKSCLVEFKNPISKAMSSMMITFTGASVNTDLNETHPIVKLNDRQVVVEGAAFEGEETGVSSMTFVINHSSFKAVAVPDSSDVIGAIVACLSFAEYAPNAIALNPNTLFKMSTEKDSIGRNLNIVQNVNGRKSINGLPVIESKDVPVGMYLAGDFQNAALLYDYTNLEMKWVEDAETALYNMVRLIFQEQFALVVYMPWAFAYGSLDELKKAITKA